MNGIHIDHLRQVERHVAAGEVHLLRQRQLIAQLEFHGHDATQARELLRPLEETQSLHTLDLERVRKEIGTSL